MKNLWEADVSEVSIPVNRNALCVYAAKAISNQKSI